MALSKIAPELGWKGSILSGLEEESIDAVKKKIETCKESYAVMKQKNKELVQKWREEKEKCVAERTELVMQKSKLILMIENHKSRKLNKERVEKLQENEFREREAVFKEKMGELNRQIENLKRVNEISKAEIQRLGTNITRTKKKTEKYSLMLKASKSNAGRYGTLLNKMQQKTRKKTVLGKNAFMPPKISDRKNMEEKAEHTNAEDLELEQQVVQEEMNNNEQEEQSQQEEEQREPQDPMVKKEPTAHVFTEDLEIQYVEFKLDDFETEEKVVKKAQVVRAEDESKENGNSEDFYSNANVENNEENQIAEHQENERGELNKARSEVILDRDKRAKSTGMFFENDNKTDKSLQQLTDLITKLLISNSELDDEIYSEFQDCESLFGVESTRRLISFLIKSRVPTEGIVISRRAFDFLIFIFKNILTQVNLNNQIDRITTGHLTAASFLIKTQEKDSLVVLQSKVKNIANLDNMTFWETIFWQELSSSFSKQHGKNVINVTQESGSKLNSKEVEFATQYLIQFVHGMSHWNLPYTKQCKLVDELIGKLKLDAFQSQRAQEAMWDVSINSEGVSEFSASSLTSKGRFLDLVDFDRGSLDLTELNNTKSPKEIPNEIPNEQLSTSSPTNSEARMSRRRSVVQTGRPAAMTISKPNSLMNMREFKQLFFIRNSHKQEQVISIPCYDKSGKVEVDKKIFEDQPSPYNTESSLLTRMALGKGFTLSVSTSNKFLLLGSVAMLGVEIVNVQDSTVEIPVMNVEIRNSYGVVYYSNDVTFIYRPSERLSFPLPLAPKLKVDGVIEFQMPFDLPEEKYNIYIKPSEKEEKKKKGESTFAISLPVAVLKESKTFFVTNPTQVFEAPIELVVIRDSFYVPRIIADTVSFYREKISQFRDLFKTDSVFRKANADSVEIHYIRYVYDTGNKPEFHNIKNPLSMVFAFKLFLRKMPEPLLTFEKYNQFAVATRLFLEFFWHDFFLIPQKKRARRCGH